MATRQLQRRTSDSPNQDLLSVVGLDPSKPVTDITDEQALDLLDETDPLRLRRTTSYYTNLGIGWWQNACYYLGMQNLEVPSLLADIDPGVLMQDGGFVANHIIRYVAANVSRRNQNKPSWSVVPLTPDQPDQDGAKVAEMLLDHAYEHTGMQRESLLLDTWLDICGTAWRYASWNANAGPQRRIYLDPSFPQPTPVDHRQLDQQQIQWLEQNKSYVDLREGDWEHEVLSPFQVIVVPSYTEMEKQPHIRIERTMPIHELWTRWPDKAPLVETDEATQEHSHDFVMRLSTLTGRPGNYGHGVDPIDGARIREIWIPPSGRCPQGRTIIGAGRQILVNEPHWFMAWGMDKVWPTIPYWYLPMPGRFHGISMVESLIGPQRDYNRGRMQMIQQRDMLGVPQWISPRGGMTQSPIRNEIGDIWEYDQLKGKPELVSPPPMSTAVLQTVQASQADMQLIAAQGDATQARTPEGVRSGLAIRALQEQDMAVIGPTIAMRENSDRQYGELLLQLAWRRMAMPRAVALYGDTKQADVTWFRGQDIRGNTKIRVVPGSQMPRSKTAAMSVMMDLIQTGAMNPAMNPADRRAAFKTLEVAHMDHIFQMEDGQRRRARQENMMFARPPADPTFAFPDVDVHDDHSLHSEEHVLFKQTDEYERLPPLRKQMFNAHISLHEEAMAEMIASMQAMQQSASPGGGGGEPGQGSKPRELGKPSPPKKSSGPAGPGE